MKTFIVSLALAAILPVSTPAAFVYEGQWSGEGVGGPLAIAANGNVYAADAGNDRVRYFTSTGSFLGQWGSHGYGAGEFDQPRDVALGPGGNVYVLDYGNYRVQYFTPAGSFIRLWGVSRVPHKIAVTREGRVYVSWFYQEEFEIYCGVKYYTSTGTFLGSWGSYGFGNGEFRDPRGIAVAADGIVYVTDSGNPRVQYFTSAGSYLGRWGMSGSGPGQFNSPRGIWVDSGGRLFVADRQNNRIQYFTSSGSFLDMWGSYGSGNGQFNLPSDVELAPNGLAYVADGGNSRVQYFREDNPAVLPSSLGKVKALFR